MAFAGRAGRAFEPPRRGDAKKSKIMFSALSRRVQVSIYLAMKAEFTMEVVSYQLLVASN
jgi:hypothetical protein